MAGYDFEVITSKADEFIDDDIPAKEAVLILSKQKAVSVSEENKSAVVLGCDTVVSLDGKILGKPKNEKEAFLMLSMLSGKTHKVYSGVCITDREKVTQFVTETDVKFYELSKESIKSYISTNEPMDKAGSYGIQGLGATLVEFIKGDYFTVVGLPLAKTARELEKFGISGKIKF